ncbi:MAG: hypothetical protein JNJ45_06895 [Chthonomonas sp.]|nr:hypothetical protein [Chthonomonas sp.]
MSEQMSPAAVKKLGLGIVFVVIAIIVMGSFKGCVKQIPPGTVGIKFNGSSGISEKLLKPEVKIVLPWEQLIIYPTSIKNASYVRRANEGAAEGDDAIPASTFEGATLPVDVTVAFHIDPANVVKAFENFGTAELSELDDHFIRSAATYAINVVSGARSIFDLTTKERAQFGPDVKAVLAPILADYGITIDDVFIGEVYPSAEVREKVSESIAVRTQLDTARNELERAKIDALTVETNAKKQAEISRLMSEQGDKAIALKRIDIRRKAIAKWKAGGGAPSVVGDGTIPFTTIAPK